MFKYYTEYKEYIKKLQTDAWEQIINDKDNNKDNDIETLKKASDEAIITQNPFDLTYITNKYTSDKTLYTDMHINIGTKFILSCDNSDGFTPLVEDLKYLWIKKTTSAEIKYEYHIGKLLEPTPKWIEIPSNNKN